MAAYSRGLGKRLKMKIRIKWIIFAALLISITIFHFYYENRISVQNGNVKNISLILKDQNNDYWKNMRLGAEVAAKEFNVKLDITAPEEQTDILGQKNLVKQAVERKADALLLAPCDYDSLVESVEYAAGKGIPVLTLDSKVNTEKTVCHIATDNLSAGKRAGEKLLKISGENSVTAIVNFVKINGSNALERDKGVMEVLGNFHGKQVIAEVDDFTDSNTATRVIKELLSKNRDISAVAALNYQVAIGAAKAIEELGLGGKIKVVAFDSDPEEIEYMEKGIIQSIIIQSPFSMGYLGVKNAVLKLQGKKIPKYIDSGFTVIDKENMYMPENQKILFHFTQ